MGRGKGKLIVRGDSIVADFYYKGERIRAALPGLSAKSVLHRKTAEQLLIRIQAGIATQTLKLSEFFPDHPKAKKYRKGGDIKISAQLEQWLERKRRQLSPSTWHDYASAIDHHLTPSFGEIFMSDLTRAHVYEWRDSLNISNKRINNVMIPLRDIFIEAFQDELIDRNPLERVRPLPKNTPEPDPFTRIEMEEILDCCESPQIRNIFEFAFCTGLRTSELIALKWSDVSLKVDAPVAYIKRVRTRAGEKDQPKTDSSERMIDLIKPAVETLKRQKQFTETGYVFLNPNTDKAWAHDGPLRKTGWIPAITKSVVRYRKMYNTRHTFASIMLSSGANPMWVARQLGHKDWGMIRKVYGRWIIDTDKHTHEKLSYIWAQN